MPVHYVVDNDARLFVSRFFGTVTREEAIDLTRRLAEAVDGAGGYRSLILFDAGIDLSTLDTPALADILRADMALFRDTGLQRRAGAAVLDSAADARIIMPLYNALADGVTGIDMHFELFEGLGAALDWLAVPREAGETLAAQTSPEIGRAAPAGDGAGDRA